MVVILDLVELYSRSSADVQFILDSTEKFDYPPIIIGGYVRHLHDDLGYNDIDWLCLNSDSYLQCCAFMEQHYIKIADSTCTKYSYYVSQEEFCNGTRNDVHQVHYVDNVVCGKTFLNWSDFTVCAVGFNKSTILKHRLFDHDVRLKQLRLNESYCLKPMRSRILKYVEKGFYNTLGSK